MLSQLLGAYQWPLEAAVVFLPLCKGILLTRCTLHNFAGSIRSDIFEDTLQLIRGRCIFNNVKLELGLRATLCLLRVVARLILRGGLSCGR